MNKKGLCTLMLVLVLILNSSFVFAAVQKINVSWNEATVTVLGETINANIIIYNGSTYVQLRPVIDKISDYNLKWTASTSTIDVYNEPEKEQIEPEEYVPKTDGGVKNLDASINTAKVLVDGENSNANVILYNGSSYVQLRPVIEKIPGWAIDWDSENKVVSVY